MTTVRDGTRRVTQITDGENVVCTLTWKRNIIEEVLYNSRRVADGSGTIQHYIVADTDGEVSRRSVRELLQLSQRELTYRRGQGRSSVPRNTLENGKARVEIQTKRNTFIQF